MLLKRAARRAVADQWRSDVNVSSSATFATADLLSTEPESRTDGGGEGGNAGMADVAEVGAM